MKTMKTHLSSTTNTLNRRLTLLLTLVTAVSTLLFSSLSLASGKLDATVDRTQVSLEETFKLTLKYNEQVMFGEPDFSGLEKNFDILGNHRSNKYRSINGRAESWTQWSLTLAPKREGKLLIPSFEYEAVFSEAIEITVKKAPSYNASATNKPVYIETEISKPKAFVQEQLLYTIRLFTSVDLSGLNRGDFAIENALLKQVSENQYQRTIDGKAYGIIEMTYAIFPQQSGTLSIPAHTWDVTIQNRQGYRYDPFLTRGGQRLRLRIDSRDVDVLPKPSNYSGQHWLPASDLRLSQNWSQPATAFKVGEPITRTVSITAKGLMGSQLPPLNLETTQGVKYYPDQPQSEESIGQDGITTVNTQSYAIVPNKPGRFTLPAITLSWWDTHSHRMREASLPVQVIEVAGEITTPIIDEAAELPVSAENAPTPTTDLGVSSIWSLVSALLALLCLVLATLWWRARSALRQAGGDITPPAKNTPPSDSEKACFNTLKTALKNGQNSAIRAALLPWGQSFCAAHELDHPNSLGQLAALSQPLAQAISQLEAQLYGTDSTQFDAAGLAQAVDALRKQPPRQASQDGVIAPLYHAR